MSRMLTVHVDLYTKICLTAIAGLLTVLVLALWAGAPLGVRQAQAGSPDALVVGGSEPDKGGGIPDTGAQRNAMIAGIRDTNQRLDRIIALLEGGKIHVTVEDKGSDGRNR